MMSIDRAFAKMPRVVLLALLCAPLLSAACHGDGSVGPGQGGLTLAWASASTSAAGDWVNGTPAVDGGRVFVQEGNRLVGLDASTGARLWSRQIRVSTAPPPTTLRASGGRVFVSETDSIMAVDAASGATVWSVHPDSQTVTEPALDDATFYTGQRGVPVVYALARADGALRWKVNVGAGYTYRAHVRGVAVSGDTVYASVERYLDLNGAAATGVLVALSKTDGHELWRYETSGTKDFFLNAPVPVGRLILVNDYYTGDLAAVDVTTHREAWRTGVGGTVDVVVVGQSAFTAGADTRARALDVTTGVVRWTGPTGSSAFGLGVCGGNVYVTAFMLRRFDGTSGEVTGDAQLGSMNGGFVTHVASDGTKVYVAGTGGVAAYMC
jgi:outer membrane protein assembly factor BamB